MGKKVKQCLLCEVDIVQRQNEGNPYFARKKFCSQKCNAIYRNRETMDKKQAMRQFINGTIVR